VVLYGRFLAGVEVACPLGSSGHSKAPASANSFSNWGRTLKIIGPRAAVLSKVVLLLLL
jgi:hypothetical protein